MCDTIRVTEPNMYFVLLRIVQGARHSNCYC